MSELPSPPPSRNLGSSGIAVSPLAWGTWRLTNSVDTSAGAVRLLRTVIEAGISLIDTADIYGFNGSSGFGDAERLIGEALAGESALRQKIVLATKGGIVPPLPYDQSSDYLRQAIEGSLRRLQTDTIDLYQIHRPDILSHPQEVARVLDDAIASGKVRAVGVSNFTVHQVTALNHFLGHQLVAIQPEISPLRIDCFENGELDQAIMLGLTPLAWSPLAGGRLLHPENPQAERVAASLDAFAEANGIDRSTAIYSWLMAHPAGIVPIIGSQDACRIAAAIQALSVKWTRTQWYAVLVAARGQKLP